MMSAERDAFTRALVAEYVSILERRGTWREEGYEPTAAGRRGAAQMALQRAAERIGVLTLRDQAADDVARGGEEQTGDG
jgi:hypothetical protein